jgi:hypothetical protein
MLSVVLLVTLLLPGTHGFVTVQPTTTTTTTATILPTTGRGRLGFSSYSLPSSSWRMMGSVHSSSKSSTLLAAKTPSHDSATTTTTTTASITTSTRSLLPDPFPQQQQQQQKSLLLSSLEEDGIIGGVSGGDAAGSRISMILFQAQKVLDPLSQTVDDATDGWALNYADLSPENESTPLGQAFLATNIAYAMAGLYLTVQGDVVLGTMLEIVSVASFAYHYTQLLQQPQQQQQQPQQDQDQNLSNRTVRTALLIDYIFAVSSILLGLVYVVVLDQQLPPMEGLISGMISFVFLFACWTWEQGVPYIILHSLWHFCSAYTGYVVGTSHLNHHLLL